MIIIVEGIDRVGKTTLCKKLADATGYKVFRDDTRYFGNHENAYINTEKINTLQCLIDDGIVNDIILDRYHLTEIVYGAYDRGYQNETMHDIDERLSSRKDVILLYVKPTDIMRSSIEHGKNLKRHNTLMKKLFIISKIGLKLDLSYNEIDEAVDVVSRIVGGVSNEKQ